jgi:hypothetical protein
VCGGGWWVVVVVVAVDTSSCISEGVNERGTMGLGQRRGRTHLQQARGDQHSSVENKLDVETRVSVANAIEGCNEIVYKADPRL